MVQHERVHYSEVVAVKAGELGWVRKRSGHASHSGHVGVSVSKRHHDAIMQVNPKRLPIGKEDCAPQNGWVFQKPFASPESALKPRPPASFGIGVNPEKSTTKGFIPSHVTSCYLKPTANKQHEPLVPCVLKVQTHTLNTYILQNKFSPVFLHLTFIWGLTICCPWSFGGPFGILICSPTCSPLDTGF